MKVNQLKTLIISLLNNFSTTNLLSTQNNTKEINGSIFESENNSEEKNIEQLIGDSFANCDSNGDGEISGNEIQTITGALNSISSITGISINQILGTQSDEESLGIIENEISRLETTDKINSSKIENTQQTIKNKATDSMTAEKQEQIKAFIPEELELTLENIQNKENELTQIILEDELVSENTKNQRVKNTEELQDITSQIKELEEKNGNLTSDEKKKLQKLSEQEAKLKNEQKEIEKEILKNCNDITKKAIEELNKFKEEYAKTESGEEIPENEEVKEEKDVEETKNSDNSTSAPHSNNGGNDSGNTNYNPQNNSNDNEKSYDKMSIEELQKEHDKEQGNLENAQNELSGVLDGTNETLTGLQTTITEKEDALYNLIKEVKPELAEDFKKVQEDKDKQQKLKGEKQSTISKQESTVNGCQRNFDNASSAVENQKNIIEQLESQQKSGDDEQNQKAASLVESAKAQLKQLEAARDDADKKLKEEKTNLETFKEELATLEKDMTPILEREENINKQISELNNTTINTAKSELDTANQEYETQKTSLEKTARDNVTSSEKKITEIEAAMTEKANSKAKSDYSITKLKGTYNLDGKEYKTLIDGDELENLSNKIQRGGAGNKWDHPDKCLSFAYSYGQWIDGSTNTPINGKSAEYPDAGAYHSKYGTKDEILAMVKTELDEGRPVVLQVNGNKDGTSRHYVTVVGYSSDAGSTLTESDLLILDTYDGLIEGMKDNGKRFMISGADCGKKYKDYQIYIRK